MPRARKDTEEDDAASFAPAATLSPGALDADALPAVAGVAGTARERFRATALRVIELNRLAAYMDTRAGTPGPGQTLGAEPGVDVRRRTAAMQYGHVREPCRISVVDYSAVQIRQRSYDNGGFAQWLADEEACAREPWVKVRWINIEGISWDVISALALKYELHPLAIEDVLHQPRSGLLSKADYYSRHLFLRVLCHTLVEDEDEDHTHDPLLYADPTLNHSYANLDDGVTGLPPRASPEPMHSASESDESDGDEDEDRTAYFDSRRGPAADKGGGALPGRSASHHVGTLPGQAASKRTGTLPLDLEGKKHAGPAPIHAVRAATLDTVARRRARRDRLRHAQAIERLKAGDRVDVRVHPLCVFLLRSNTLLTLSRSAGFAAPIARRLRHRDTALRASADASLLAHAVLDLVADGALPVVAAYQAALLALEHQILLRPRMATVRALHILQQDLAQHTRTLEPVKTVAHGLRRYDADRAAALLSEEDRLKGVEARGFMSHKAKIYMADVVDHMDYVLSSMAMFAGTTDNLIDYTFNMISYSMNDTMKRLTLATIVFLPLTFLTGYFGMNFDKFYSIHHFSDAFVWAIGLPIVAIVTSMFMWGEITDMVAYVKKRFAGRHDADVMQRRKRRRSSRRSTR